MSTRKNVFYAIIIGVIGMFMFGCGSEDNSSISSINQAVVNEGHSWTHADWSSRVLYEARYALSRTYADGTSNNPIGTSPNYTAYYGDWNYVANDSSAHTKASAEAGGGDYVGPVGQSGSYYLGGQCTYFVRLVLYRATYWNFSDHYTTPNYGISSMYTVTGEMDSNPSNWQGGWALRGNGHYAIAEQRAYFNGSWGWWVIDSNWLGGGGNYRIGKHFFTDSQLSSGGYYGWKPVRASYNW
ncbi:hypothetical protein L6278_00845 [Candidatus Parcubacteria bacterium]|nr:hypothetical protein [Candidatus Parcubacteria bacterium]